jgi:hypothetical protein
VREHNPSPEDTGNRLSSSLERAPTCPAAVRVYAAVIAGEAFSHIAATGAAGMDIASGDPI